MLGKAMTLFFFIPWIKNYNIRWIAFSSGLWHMEGSYIRTHVTCLVWRYLYYWSPKKKNISKITERQVNARFFDRLNPVIKMIFFTPLGYRFSALGKKSPRGIWRRIFEISGEIMAVESARIVTYQLLELTPYILRRWIITIQSWGSF